MSVLWTFPLMCRGIHRCAGLSVCSMHMGIHRYATKCTFHLKEMEHSTSAALLDAHPPFPSWLNTPCITVCLQLEYKPCHIVLLVDNETAIIICPKSLPTLRARRDGQWNGSSWEKKSLWKFSAALISYSHLNWKRCCNQKSFNYCTSNKTTFYKMVPLW